MEEKRRKWTKEYRTEYMRKWRAEHREEMREYYKQYRIKHFWDIKYYKSPPEKRKIYNKTYYEKHKNDEEFKKRSRECYKRWREKNRDKWNAYQREQKAKKRAEERV